MQTKNKKLTLKRISEQAGCEPYVVRYLLDCRRLKIVRESKGPGYPVLFHPDSVDIVKAHLAKRND